MLIPYCPKVKNEENISLFLSVTP